MWLARLAYKIWDGFVFTWQFFVMLSVIVTLVSLCTLWPSFDISPGPSRDKNDPLETRFIVTNKTLYHLNEVSYICQYKFGKAGFTNTIFSRVDTDSYTLNSGAPLSMYCGPLSWPFTEAQTGFLTIHILYRLPGLPQLVQDYGILFVMRRDKKSGEVIWLPGGAGLSIKDGIEYLRDHDP
jgi:hypothetical protein